MAWGSSFTNPSVGPSSLVGPGAAVPTSPAEIAGGLATWLLGITFRNNDSVTHTVTVTDSAGHVVFEETLAPNSGLPQPYAPTFEPVTGLKWSADGSNVVGHIWGYQ